MFNPQRKAKIADIYFQQKAFQRHLDKMRQIKKSASPKSARDEQERLQLKYLERLRASKQQVKDRLNTHVNRENHRLFQKLIEADQRPEQNPERKISKKHFNSYFSTKKSVEKIREQNYGLINRMINQTALVPHLDQMKKQFKQSKRYSKMIRKLPAILKHQEQFRHDLSLKKLTDSKTSLNTSRKDNNTVRSSTQQINYIQNQLLKKQ